MSAQTRELHRLVRKWQERLRLTDWRIHAEFVTALDDNADTSLCRDNREAHIRFSPQPANQYGEPIDLEEIIVHELGHILFAPFEEATVVEGQKVNTDVEFALNAYAQALIALDR